MSKGKLLFFAIMAGLSVLAVSAFAQRSVVEVRNPRGEQLNTLASQSGTWNVEISTGVTVDIASALVEEHRFTVSVTAGSGFAVFSSTGTMRQCAIIPPSDTARYNFDVETNDADGFPVLGRDGLLGTVSLMVSRIVLGSHKGIISSATQDGSYKVRCLTQK